MRPLRRISVTLAAMLMALGLSAGSALAFQPPADAAADNFGCVYDEEEGEYKTDPVNGHPGVAGLRTDGPSFNNAATPLGDGPTAWNAVHKDNPVVAGTCHKAEES